MSEVVFEDVAVRAGQFALCGVGFTIRRGSCAALMGPTGCGKTTLLEALCGLRPIRRGRITVDGRDVTRLRPGSRGIGYVPQDGALFATMTVGRQMLLPLRLRGVPAREARRAVAQMADDLRITHLLARKPRGLSGGERQRVALGRALVFRPSVLCLDEPLSALDDDTRQAMLALLERVFADYRPTCLLVTHARAEAARLADTVVRIAEGAVLPDAPDSGAPTPTTRALPEPTHAHRDRVHSPAR